ncbi:MAG TPA: hypothetical protein VD861_07075 [Pyrinomonadaceae bacterium]|nr:hypothetical protein [Pyrinomonadaceae bacterium]
MSVAAQQQEKAPCPVIRLEGPPKNEQTGLIHGWVPVTLSAEVDGRKLGDTVTVKWSASGGEISSGQGTPTITVVADPSQPIQRLNVTAEFDGLGAGCPRKATWASLIEVAIQEPWVKADEYGDIPRKQEGERLYGVAMMLRAYTSDLRLRIIPHDGPNRRNEKAARRAERARDYLIKKHGIEPGRIVLGPKNPSTKDPYHTQFALEFLIEPVKDLIPPCKEEPQ